MAVFPIRVYPDPVLRTPAAAVARIDGDIGRLVDDMLETMYQAPGVGLAAPQIGVALRVVVFDIGGGPHHLINPVLLETSGAWSFDEGCLSVPGRYWPVRRPGFAGRGASIWRVRRSSTPARSFWGGCCSTRSTTSGGR